MNKKGKIVQIGIFAVLAMVALSALALGSGDFQFKGDKENMNKQLLSYAQSSTTTTQTIEKGDLFLLAVPSKVDSVGEVLEYKGADRSTRTNPKIKFKYWKTGETLEYSIRYVGNVGEVTIRLGGESFKVQLTQPTQRDSVIIVDYEGDGTLDVNPRVKDLFYKHGVTSVTGTGFSCGQVVTLLEGEGKYLSTNQGTKKLSLLSVTNNEVLVKVHGIPSSLIELGQSQYVNGMNIHPINILYQNYAGGIKQATFCV